MTALVITKHATHFLNLIKATTVRMMMTTATSSTTGTMKAGFWVRGPATSGDGLLDMDSIIIIS